MAALFSSNLRLYNLYLPSVILSSKTIPLMPKAVKLFRIQSVPKKLTYIYKYFILNFRKACSWTGNPKWNFSWP